MPDIQDHHRRSVRLPAYDYAAPGAYFVTIVAQGRVCSFGDIANGVMVLSARGRVAEACWREIPSHFPHVELGAFVVMPNHVHGILILHERADANDRAEHRVDANDRAWMIPSPPVGAQHAAPLPVPSMPHIQPGSLGAIVRSYKSAVTRAIGRPAWQRGFYEHVIRDERDWDRTRRYIETNPAAWPDDEENA